MKIIFDLIILGILVGGSYAGIKFGFFKMVAKPIKVAASLVFALLLCSGVGKAIISPIIQAPVTNYVKDFMYTNCASLTPENVSAEIPTLLKMSGAAFNIDLGVTAGLSTDQLLDNIVFKLTSPFVTVVSILFAFVILYFVGKLLISLGIFCVNKYCEGGVVAKVNKIMGFILAGLVSFIAAWAFVSVTDFFFHLPIFDNSSAIQSFNGGLFYRLFNSFSPLELLLSF